MKIRIRPAICAAFLTGTLLGLSLAQPRSEWTVVAHAQQTAQNSPTEEATLRSEVERLKQVVPDQAHAMQDVDYHFTNLWFAGNHGHWPLAQFYLNETRSHLRWAVRIIPVRKDSQGQEIKLEEILQSIENGPLGQVEAAVKAENREKFVEAYETTLASCYACHKASDKPFLRPRIPERPATTIMSLDPNAAWPQ